MISDYLKKQLNKAKLKKLKDGIFFSSIPACPGVWANKRTLSATKKELQEVLEEWILLKIRSRERVPGFYIKFDRRSMFKHA